MCEPTGKLSGRAGENLPQVLVGGDALFDSKHELRRVVFYHLPDARAKLVEEVKSRVVANRRTEIVERRRSGAHPIRTGSVVGSDRSEHPEKIRGVQPPFSRVVTRDTKARSCVRGPVHKAAAGQRVITQVLFGQWWIQILTNKVAGPCLSGLRIEGGKAGLRSWSEVPWFCFTHCARAGAHRTKC